MKPKQAICPYCKRLTPHESRFCMWCGKQMPEHARLRIQDLLDRLSKGDWTETLCNSITTEFGKNWASIKELSVLTGYFINVMLDAQTPEVPSFIIPRSNQGGDASTGPVFENLFVLLFLLFVQADPRSRNPDGSPRLNYMKNKGVAIPGMNHKQKPDLLVRCDTDLRPLLVVELKASFSKHSLIKTFADFAGTYHLLAPDLPCYFVIFRTSEQKKNTYKSTVPACRIICHDFNSANQPKIVDPVEDIFEELRKSLNLDTATPHLFI